MYALIEEQSQYSQWFVLHPLIIFIDDIPEAGKPLSLSKLGLAICHDKIYQNNRVKRNNSQNAFVKIKGISSKPASLKNLQLDGSGHFIDQRLIPQYYSSATRSCTPSPDELNYVRVWPGYGNQAYYYDWYKVIYPNSEPTYWYTEFTQTEDTVVSYSVRSVLEPHPDYTPSFSGVFMDNLSVETVINSTYKELKCVEIQQHPEEHEFHRVTVNVHAHGVSQVRYPDHSQSESSDTTYNKVFYLVKVDSAMSGVTYNSPLDTLKVLMDLEVQDYLAVVRADALMNDRSATEINNVENFSDFSLTEPVKSLLSLLKGAVDAYKHKNLREAIRIISDAYLLWKYVISPTISDAKELSAYFKGFEARENMLRPGATVQFFGKPIDSAVVDSSKGNVLTRSSHATFDATYGHVTIVVKWYMTPKGTWWSKLYQLMDDLGVELSLSNVWDLIPFSFMIDWFINIGDLLEAPSALQNYGLEFNHLFTLETVIYDIDKYDTDGFHTVATYYNRSIKRDIQPITVKPELGHMTASRLAQGAAIILG
jgi:hypothetical protein